MGDGPSAPPSAPTAAAARADPLQLLRERSYIVLLLLAAIIGVPVAAVAYGFLALAVKGQEWVFSTLPVDLGFDSAPVWWPIPFLALGGLLVALAIERLPGTGGHSPAEGFKSSGAPTALELPGIILAALGSLILGAVVGPEAPLIAIGSGLAVLILHLLKKDAPVQAVMVIGAAGSFAAISTLLGSPILGAFLLMEVAGLAGPMIGVVLVPGLLAAGIGSLIFLGLDSLTGPRHLRAVRRGHPVLRHRAAPAVPLGHPDRPPGRGPGHRHQAQRPTTREGRGATADTAHAARRGGGRPQRGGVRPAHRPRHGPGAVRRPEPPSGR